MNKFLNFYLFTIHKNVETTIIQNNKQIIFWMIIYLFPKNRNFLIFIYCVLWKIGKKFPFELNFCNSGSGHMSKKPLYMSQVWGSDNSNWIRHHTMTTKTDDCSHKQDNSSQNSTNQESSVELNNQNEISKNIWFLKIMISNKNSMKCLPPCFKFIANL